MTLPDGTPHDLLTFAGALSKDWENPASVENVVTMPSDPGIYGAMVGLFTNWIEFIAHTDYDDRQRYRKLPGEKAVFMNPATTRADIDTFIAHIRRGI